MIPYPRWHAARDWVKALTDVFRSHQAQLDTGGNAHKSDQAMRILRSDLVQSSFEVEADKTHAGKLFRPVFFGENGEADRRYEIDAYHPSYRVALEIEAGRSVMGNAIYRDIIQRSLLVGVQFEAVAIPLHYRYNSGGKQSTNEAYRDRRSILEAIYGGQRLSLPFSGFLLVGY